MVGLPAAGKSTISKRFFHDKKGYVLINQDTLGTAAKCAKGAQEALATGKSVVIDNTNGPADKRKEWITMAKNAGVCKVTVD